MKLCETCVYRNKDEYHKPCIAYRDDCGFYEKEKKDMTREEAKKIIHRHVMLFSSMPDDVLEAIQTLEQESCGDAISRQAVLNILEREGHKWGNDYRDWVDAVNEVEILSSVNQEPKTGHWKRISIDLYVQHATAYYQCSECGEKVIGEHNYCQFCGARMEERNIHCNHTDTEIAKSFIEDVEAVKDLLPQESEDKE